MRSFTRSWPWPRSVSPTNTPRRSPGTKSVRATCRPPARGRRIFTWPQPLVKRLAGPIHRSPIPNQIPSTSLIGGLQTPPISPRVWKPIAG
jgi:hypothetical protein